MNSVFTDVHSLYVPEFSYDDMPCFSAEQYLNLIEKSFDTKLSSKEIESLVKFFVPGFIDIAMIEKEDPDSPYIDKIFNFATENKLTRMLHLSGTDILSEYYARKSFNDKKAFVVNRIKDIMKPIMFCNELFESVEYDENCAFEGATGVLVFISVNAWEEVKKHPDYKKRHIIEEIIRKLIINTGISSDFLYLVLGGESHMHTIRPVTRLCYVNIDETETYNMRRCVGFLEHFKKTALFMILTHEDMGLLGSNLYVEFQSFNERMYFLDTRLCMHADVSAFYCIDNSKTFEGEYVYHRELDAFLPKSEARLFLN